MKGRKTIPVILIAGASLMAQMSIASVIMAENVEGDISGHVYDAALITNGTWMANFGQGKAYVNPPNPVSLDNGIQALGKSVFIRLNNEAKMTLYYNTDTTWASLWADTANPDVDFSVWTVKGRGQAGRVSNEAKISIGSLDGTTFTEYDSVSWNAEQDTYNVELKKGARYTMTGAETGTLVVRLSNHELATNTSTAENGVYMDGVNVSTIPEPATLSMIAVFGAGILFIRRRFAI